MFPSSPGTVTPDCCRPTSSASCKFWRFINSPREISSSPNASCQSNLTIDSSDLNEQLLELLLILFFVHRLLAAPEIVELRPQGGALPSERGHLRILDRNWHTWSWQGISANQRLA